MNDFTIVATGVVHAVYAVLHGSLERVRPSVRHLEPRSRRGVLGTGVVVRRRRCQRRRDRGDPVEQDSRRGQHTRPIPIGTVGFEVSVRGTMPRPTSRRMRGDEGAASSLTVVLLTPVFVVLAFATFQAAMWGHARTEARVIAHDTAALVARSGVPPSDRVNRPW